jgi:hypothetical protein
MALGVCLFYLGDVATAHTHLQAGATIGDTQLQPSIFPIGQDLRVLSLSYDAMVLRVLGYPAQALERSRRALNIAEEVAQPWALAMAQGYAALVHVLRGDMEAAMERVVATIQLATGQGVLPWIGLGMMLRGWALAEQGQETAGLAQMRQGLAAWQANGQELGKPFWLGLLGARCAKAGLVAEGLQLLAEALTIAQTRESRIWEAELQRLHGELLLQQAVSTGLKPGSAKPSRSTGTVANRGDEAHLFSEAEAYLRRPSPLLAASTPNCGSGGVRAKLLASSWRIAITGSPRALTRRTSGRPKPSWSSSEESVALCQVDDDVAVGIEFRAGLRGHDASGVVLLDNAWPFPSHHEVNSPQHRCLQPTGLGPEIGLAGRQAALFIASTGRELLGHARAHWNSLSDHLNVDDLHRLLRASAMAVRAFVLLPKGLDQVCQGFGIQRALGHRYRELEGLPLVMHVGGATDAHLLRAEAVHRELLHSLARQLVPGLAQVLGVDGSQ